LATGAQRAASTAER